MDRANAASQFSGVRLPMAIRNASRLLLWYSSPASMYASVSSDESRIVAMCSDARDRIQCRDVDTARCDSCSSNINRTAYLKDSLRLLQSPTLEDGKTLHQKLFERRPDLATVDLAGANANNLIPYTDITYENLQSCAKSLDK
ncbi:hypothetical protein BDV12DRAFT_200735 [Aspergillus spectabilis]